jgi:hypothetical protein
MLASLGTAQEQLVCCPDITIAAPLHTAVLPRYCNYFHKTFSELQSVAMPTGLHYQQPNRRRRFQSSGTGTSQTGATLML